MTARLHAKWTICKLFVDANLGITVEDADLGDGKHMIVATDTQYPIGGGDADAFRQVGFGPFELQPGKSVLESLPPNMLDDLKQTLIWRRTLP
jgi:hypothetical protein